MKCNNIYEGEHSNKVKHPEDNEFLREVSEVKGFTSMKNI